MSFSDSKQFIEQNDNMISINQNNKERKDEIKQNNQQS